MRATVGLLPLGFYSTPNVPFPVSSLSTKHNGRFIKIIYLFFLIYWWTEGLKFSSMLNVQLLKLRGAARFNGEHKNIFSRIKNVWNCASFLSWHTSPAVLFRLRWRQTGSHAHVSLHRLCRGWSWQMNTLEFCVCGDIWENHLHRNKRGTRGLRGTGTCALILWYYSCLTPANQCSDCC